MNTDTQPHHVMPFPDMPYVQMQLYILFTSHYPTAPDEFQSQLLALGRTQTLQSERLALDPAGFGFLMADMFSKGPIICSRQFLRLVGVWDCRGQDFVLKPFLHKILNMSADLSCVYAWIVLLVTLSLPPLSGLGLSGARWSDCLGGARAHGKGARHL